MGGRQNTGNLILFKCLQVVEFFFQFFIAVADDQPVSFPLQLVFSAAGKLREKGVRNIRKQKPDQSGFSFIKRAGNFIRIIIQLLHGKHDLRSCIFMHVAVVIEDTRDRGNRDAGSACDIFNRCQQTLLLHLCNRLRKKSNTNHFGWQQKKRPGSLLVHDADLRDIHFDIRDDFDGRIDLTPIEPLAPLIIMGLIFPADAEDIRVVLLNMADHRSGLAVQIC